MGKFGDNPRLLISMFQSLFYPLPALQISRHPLFIHLTHSEHKSQPIHLFFPSPPTKELFLVVHNVHCHARSVAQSCLTLFDPHGLYSARLLTVHGILQARILECLFPSPGDLPTKESNPSLLYLLH